MKLNDKQKDNLWVLVITLVTIEFFIGMLVLSYLL